MTDRARDGFRRAPGGEDLQILIEYSESTPVPAMELIKEYWEAVGVKVLLKVETSQSRNVTRTLNEHDVRASGIGEASETGQYITGGGEQFTCNRSRGVTADSRWMPCGTDNGWGWQWGKWLAANAAIKAGTHTLADFGGNARLGAAAGDQGSRRVVVGAARHRVRLPRVRRASVLSQKFARSKS